MAKKRSNRRARSQTSRRSNTRLTTVDQLLTTKSTLPVFPSIELLERLRSPLGITIEASIRTAKTIDESLVIASIDQTENGSITLAQLGFCNRELRPCFRVKLKDGQNLVEVFANETLAEDKVYHLAGTYDNTSAKLYVSGKLAAESRAPGTFEPLHKTVQVRVVTDLLQYCPFVRFWKTARSLEELSELVAVQWPAAPFSYFEENASGLFVTYHFPLPHCAFWMAPKPQLAFHGKIRLAEAILRDAGRIQPDRSLPPEILPQASRTILQCCLDLQRLIDYPDTREPDLLKFFRMNPESTFLLEPEREECWRECPIQGAGQIDFVFRRFDKRYVIVEVEGSHSQIFTSLDEFTAQYHHAITQIRDWQQGVEQNQSVAEDHLGLTEIQSPTGLLVMGRLNQLSNPKRRERWNRVCQESPIRHMTWDDVINRGRHFAKQLGDTSIPKIEWT